MNIMIYINQNLFFSSQNHARMYYETQKNFFSEGASQSQMGRLYIRKTKLPD
jgi:hypothetical protein